MSEWKTIHETLASQQTEIFRSEMERQREWEENMLRAEREENARLLHTITQTFFQNISILLHFAESVLFMGM
jgi:hypothetical protein